MYVVDVKGCLSWKLSKDLISGTSGSITLPLNSTCLNYVVTDYYWNSDKPLIKITFYKQEKRERRLHRKKRINKKWKKRYGAKYYYVEVPYSEVYSVTKKTEDYVNKTVTLDFGRVFEQENFMLHGGNFHQGSLAGTINLLTQSFKSLAETMKGWCLHA